MKEGVPYSLMNNPVYKRIIDTVMGNPNIYWVERGNIVMSKEQEHQIQNLIKMMEE
jgi:hypothetical protein